MFTGHGDGVITINVAEADAVREKIRVQLREPYRTLLGHFRHEIGHYYWDRLIATAAMARAVPRAVRRRARDYAEALQSATTRRAAGRLAPRFISAYATMHPWEDWAETWAHYLHMVDTLETAVRPRPPSRADEPRQLCREGRQHADCVRRADRSLVPADQRAQQPESQPGTADATRSCCQSP